MIIYGKGGLFPPRATPVVVQTVYEEEQWGYYILSSFWAELEKEQLLGRPAVLKMFDMYQCTLEDVQVGKLCVFLRERWWGVSS